MLGLKIGLLIPEFYYMRYYLRWVTHHLKCGILSVIWQSCVWSGLCIISFYMKLLVRDGAHAQINLKININVLKNGFPRWLSGKNKQTNKKNPPANKGNMGSIPGLGRSSGEGNGNPLQYSCLGNPPGGLQSMGL